MGHLQEVGNVCQLGGRGSVCGPFQSGWVKYEIQLPGFILVYGSYLCMEPSPAALQGMGAVCVLCVCVCVECAETTVGITRNVSKSDGTVNSHLSPGRVLDDLPILATSQAAFFLSWSSPNWSDLFIEFPLSSKFGKTWQQEPIQENALSSLPLLGGGQNQALLSLWLQ